MKRFESAAALFIILHYSSAHVIDQLKASKPSLQFSLFTAKIGVRLLPCDHFMVIGSLCTDGCRHRCEPMVSTRLKFPSGTFMETGFYVTNLKSGKRDNNAEDLSLGSKAFDWPFLLL